jgi:hypothetical protein
MTGWATTSDGRRSRVYDTPRTPLDRLIASGILTPENQAELIAYHDSLGPAAIAGEIDRIHQNAPQANRWVSSFSWAYLREAPRPERLYQ